MWSRLVRQMERRVDAASVAVLALDILVGVLVAFLVGGLLTWTVSFSLDLSWLVPFAAGNFIYIGAADLIPEINKYEDLRSNSTYVAAFLAGLAEGVWPDLAAIQDAWQLDATFEPEPDRTVADLAHAQWLRAVDRSRNWAD